MDLATLYALRSPAGVPSHPVIFLVLGVLTWALHILAVQVTLGSSLMSLVGLTRREGADASHWRRLAMMLLNHAKIGVSIAIVVGVAPLLFVQVIYDPFWYVSNVLSARWAIGFIVILLLAYWALWLHYWSVHRRQADAHAPLAWGVISLALLLVVGFIMHVLTSQMLHPEAWKEWYAPNGVIDPSGSRIHAFNLGRYGFIMALALPVTGAWLMACRQYLSARDGEDPAYLNFLARQAAMLTMIGGLVALALLVLWMLSLPTKSAAFALSPWTALVALTVILLTLLGRSKLNGYWAFAWALVTALSVGIIREAYRHAVLYGLHGYDFMNYKINMDWYSTVLFFVTFALVGGISLVFMISLAWKAGQSRGVYTAGPVISKLGTLAVVVTGLWVVQYFLFGAITLMR
ncbi:MAG: hypothetical protein ACUVT2_03775 [Thiobacillaceae bacterium]